MISAVRNFAKSPWAFLVLIPIIASFALFGIQDIFNSGGTAVAIVGPERVTVTEFRDAYNRELRSYQQQDPSFTPALARQYGLPEQVLNRLVVEEAMEGRADALGVGASERVVASQIQRIEAFRNPVTGRYDPDTARDILATNGYTERSFYEIQAGVLTRAQLTGPLFTGHTALRQLARTRYAYNNERRVLSAMIFQPDPTALPEDPGDEVLQQVIDDNQDYAVQGYPVFAHPERRAFTLVRFRIADFEEDVEVAEEEIRAQYDYMAQTGQLGSAATRGWTQAGAPDADTAQAAAARIAAGEDFSAVATELGLTNQFSQDPLEDFEIPDSAVREAVFAMAEGEAQAIEARAGWSVLRVDAAEDGDMPTFEEAREEMRSELAASLAEENMFQVIGEFEGLRSDGLSLSEAAAGAGAVAEIYAPIDRYGINEDGAPAATLATRAEGAILEAVFNATPGIPVELESYGEGDYYSLQVADIVESRPIELAEARSRALAFWRNRQVEEMLTEQAEAALARIEAGEDFQAVADDLGVDVESATVLRTETAGALTAEAVSYGFAFDVGHVELLAGQRGAQILMRIDEIVPAGEPELGELAGLAGDLDAALAEDLAVQFQSALLADYGYSDEDIDPRLFLTAIGENPDDQ